MNNDGAEPPMFERLTQLGVQFLQRTSREMVSLRTLLAQLRGGDAAAFEQIKQLTHRIHGTGAIFGFAPISDYAGGIERLLDEHSIADMPLNIQTLDRLAENLTLLENELERATLMRAEAQK